MSHHYAGPLAAYNSLTDKHLTGYFNNTRIRRHLQRVGLVTRSGRIVSEKEYRLNAMRKDHQKYIRECLAQAIFHKVLDMERHHQIEIKRKLENFARKERIQKTKVDRPKRLEEDALPLFSPRPPTGPKSSFGRNNLRDGEQSDCSESPSSSRPNTAPGSMQRPVRLEPLPGSAVKTTSSTQPKTSALDADHQFATMVDKDLLKLMNTVDPSTGISPYRLPIINNYVTPAPPTMKKSDRNPNMTRSGTSRGRRFRPTTAPHGFDLLSPKDPVRFHKTSLHSNVAITMIYLGQSVRLSHDDMDYRDEIKVFQQHCGGENLCIFKGNLLEGETFQCTSRRHRGFPFSLTFYINGLQVDRLSSCCEYKHRKGARLGGKHGYFRFVEVEGASPCYRCIIAMGLDKKPSPPPKKRKEDPEDEDFVDLKVDIVLGTKKTEEQCDEEVQWERPVSVAACGTNRTSSEEEFISERDETKDDQDDENVDTAKDEYDEDFEADEDKGDEEINEEEPAAGPSNAASPPHAEGEGDDLDPGRDGNSSSHAAAESPGSHRDGRDEYSDTECEQVEKQDRRGDIRTPSSSTHYNSTSRDESDVEEIIKENAHEDAESGSCRGTPTRKDNYSRLKHDSETEDAIQTEESADENSPGREADTIDDETDVNEGAEDSTMKDDIVTEEVVSGHPYQDRDHVQSRIENVEQVKLMVPPGSQHEADIISMGSSFADDEGDSKSIQEKIAEAIENPRLLNAEPEPSDSSTDEEDNPVGSVPERSEEHSPPMPEEGPAGDFCLEDAIDTEDQPMNVEPQIIETIAQEASMMELGEEKAEDNGTEEEATIMEETPENATSEVGLSGEMVEAHNQEMEQPSEMEVTKEEEMEGQIMNEETEQIEEESQTHAETLIDEVQENKEGAREAVEEGLIEDATVSTDTNDVVPTDGGLEGFEPDDGTETNAEAAEVEDAVDDLTDKEEVEVQAENVLQMGSDLAERAEEENQEKAADEESPLIEDAPYTRAIESLEGERLEIKSPQTDERTSEVCQDLETDTIACEINDDQIDPNITGEGGDMVEDDAAILEPEGEVEEDASKEDGAEMEIQSEEEVIADELAPDNAVPEGDEIDQEGASQTDEPDIEDAGADSESVKDVPTSDMIHEDVQQEGDALLNEEGVVCEEALKGENGGLEEITADDEDTNKGTTPEGEEGAMDTADHTSESVEEAAGQGEMYTMETPIEEQESFVTVLQDKEGALETSLHSNSAAKEDASERAEAATEVECEAVQDVALNEDEPDTEDNPQEENTVTDTTSTQEETCPSEDHAAVLEVDAGVKEELPEMEPEEDGTENIHEMNLGEVQENEEETGMPSAEERGSPDPAPNVDEANNETPLEEIQAKSDELVNETGQGEDITEACPDGKGETEGETENEQFKGEEEASTGGDELMTEGNNVGMEQDEENTETVDEVDLSKAEPESKAEEADSATHAEDGGEIPSEETQTMGQAAPVAALKKEETTTEMVSDGEQVNEEAASKIEDGLAEIPNEEAAGTELTPSGAEEAPEEVATEVEELSNEGEKAATNNQEEVQESVPEETALMEETASEEPEVNEETASDAAVKLGELITEEALECALAEVRVNSAVEESECVFEEAANVSAEEPEKELLPEEVAAGEGLDTSLGSEGIVHEPDSVVEMIDTPDETLEEALPQAEESAETKTKELSTEDDEAIQGPVTSAEDAVETIAQVQTALSQPDNTEAPTGEDGNPA
ncbi:glutamate-rich protein 3 isoform X2 [Ambystoma mexicanum]|uniref:glutamate-rich protein 3 isoform X2 n=1 Tax=Ambystoma mexicanum TaxID=8296 RepID=UPI0037E8A26C